MERDHDQPRHDPHSRDGLRLQEQSAIRQTCGGRGVWCGLQECRCGKSHYLICSERWSEAVDCR